MNKMANEIILTNDFIWNLIEDRLSPDTKPVVQVMKIQMIQSGSPYNIMHRVQISDGQFAYSNAGFVDGLTDQIVQDGLDDLSKKAIIRIKEWKRTHPANIDKPILSITSYELMRKFDYIIGNPIRYKNRDSLLERQCGSLQPLRYNTDDRKRPANAAPMGLNNNISFLPIKVLNPSILRWRIKGVVKGKEEIREPKNSKKVFNFQIMDADGEFIRAVAWDSNAGHFYPIVQNDQSIYLSGPGHALIDSNKHWNGTGHPFEIRLSREYCEVQICDELLSPSARFNFKRLSQIPEFSGLSMDVLAIIDKVEGVIKINTKNGEMNLRKVYLVDQSGTMVELTLWGSQCDDFDVHSEHQVLAIKGAFVREFNGSFSLGISGSTFIDRGLNDRRSATLRRWYQNVRPNVNLKILSNTTLGQNFERDLRLIGAIETNYQLGRREKGDFFNIIALINSIRIDNAVYKACVNDGCKKKLIQVDHEYRCEKCNITTPNFKFSMRFPIELADISAVRWATAFEEVAVQLIGINARELGTLQQEDMDAYNRVFDSIRFRTYQCRIRAKADLFNDQEQIKWTIYEMKRVNYDAYNKYLQKSVELMDESAIDDDW